VRGIELALHRDLTGAYQLGAGKPTSLQQLITALRATTGLDFEIRYEPARGGEVHTTWCDISKAARELGYSAPTDLEEGLRRTWQWFTTKENSCESELEPSSSFD